MEYIHDTCVQPLAIPLAVLEVGVEVFDSTAAGLSA